MQPGQSQQPSFEQEFMASLHQPASPTPSPQAAPKKRPKWIFLALASPIIIAIIAIAVVLLMKPTADTPADNSEDFADNVYDQNTLDEQLNDEFRKAASSGAYANYQTDTEATTFNGQKPLKVCQDINISCVLLAEPNNIEKAERVETLNANALNYYLDANYIVIMSFLAKEEQADTPTIYVIYAADHEMGQYSVFIPAQWKSMAYMNRTDLFENIQGVPDFYIIKTNGYL